MSNVLLVLHVGNWDGVQCKFISCSVKINWFKHFQLLMRETTYRQHINLIPILFSSTLFVVCFEKGQYFRVYHLKVG